MVHVDRGIAGGQDSSFWSLKFHPGFSELESGPIHPLLHPRPTESSPDRGFGGQQKFFQNLILREGNYTYIELIFQQIFHFIL